MKIKTSKYSKRDVIKISCRSFPLNEKEADICQGHE